MVKYAREPADAEKSAKARASDLRISFKNMRETCMMLKGMQLEAAQQYLKDVVAMKRCVVFRRFCGGVGRTAQAKNEGSTNGQGRWPKKCAEILINLLNNAGYHTISTFAKDLLKRILAPKHFATWVSVCAQR